MEFNEKTIQKETIYNGQLINLEKHIVEIYNGKQAKREVIRHKPAVGILAITDEQMVFVKQYRKAIEKPILEIPAGLVEPGEDWLLAAKRELAEETQLAGEQWDKLDSFFTSPGFLDEKIQIYKCSQITELDNPPAQDADEHIGVVFLTLAEAKQAILAEEICDMKTIYAVNQWEILKLKGE